MNKPKVICHMVSSIDGRITGDYLNKAEDTCEEYYRIHREIKADAFLCGRVTMESSFTHYKKADLSQYLNDTHDRKDYINNNYDFYAVCIDQHGKVGWDNAYIQDEDPGYDHAHIIEVLSENVSDAYLSYLRNLNISYIFAGSDKIDLNIVLDKLYRLFSIQTLLLEGGGIVNGTFMKENLIDELSIVYAPFINSTYQSSSLFEYNDEINSVQYKISDINKINDNIWIKYKKR